MKYRTYARPASLVEAYALLQNKNTVILGGNLWLRMRNKTYSCAVDLSALGLDGMEETEEGISIGASVSLRTMETSPLLNTYAQNAFRTALSPIVGVQFRNTATVGGSVFGRFGFSDVLTLLSSLGASVSLYHAGTVSVRDFAENGAEKDILTAVLLPKDPPDRIVYLAQRNAATDFPVLNTAVCLRGNVLSVTVGARPLRAVNTDYPYSGTLSEDRIRDIANELSETLTFGSNRMASEGYRRHLCRVLVTRALQAL